MADRPNILLLHTDQQRFDALSAFGLECIQTPNMDRLVRRGLTFTNAYSSSPVCMAARHDLLTGTSARHHGFYQNQPRPVRNPEIATLPRMLTAAGYQTFGVGKMHHWPEREHHGFNHLRLMEEIPDSWENDDYVQYLLRNKIDTRCQHGVRPIFYPTPQRCPFDEEHTGSAWVARETVELLKRKRAEPFFIFSSWVGPHPPFFVPEHYLEMVDQSKLRRSITVPSEDEGRAITPEIDIDHPWVERFKVGYYAQVALIDRWLGEVLDTLDETGLSENTVIIFTSDHGELLGDRRLFSKTKPYESSAHIPFIISGPGIPEGERTTTPITTFNTTATILSLACARVPGDHPLIGKSVLGFERDEPRSVAFSLFEGNRRWVASTDGQSKYIHYYNERPDEFYDLSADPWEQQNIIDAADPDALRQTALEYERDHGHPDAVAEGGLADTLGAGAPDALPAQHSVPWPFNWAQYPQWMPHYTDEDRQAVLEEMRAVIEAEGRVHVPEDHEWRDECREWWERQTGGRPAELDTIFELADAHQFD